jgi:hypothetical protein
MSLVGSLEDLSLGDILQIISLSQKSGVLALETTGCDGRIVFVNGLVRGAAIKDGPQDLRGLLVGGGFVSEDEFAAAEEHATSRGCSVVEAVAEVGALSGERVESLCREAIESAVITMFSWTKGDFSFDVRSEPMAGDPELLAPGGVNAQYLAMEGARLRDEGGGEHESVAQAGDETDDEGADAARFDEMSAHEMFGVAPEATPDADGAGDADASAHAAAVDALAMASVAKVEGRKSGLSDKASALAAEIMALGAAVGEEEGGAETVEEIDLGEPIDPIPFEEADSDADSLPEAWALDDEPAPTEAEVGTSPVGLDSAEPIDAFEQDRFAEETIVAEPSDGTTEAAGAPEADASVETSAEPVAEPAASGEARPLVVIDRDLVALEWVKEALQDDWKPIHIFQQTEQAMARIRQYLVRGTAPVVLVAPDIDVDHLGGVVDALDFVARLKAQSPRIVALWLREDGSGGVTRMGAADGAVVRPDANRLRAPGAAERLAEDTVDFARQVRIDVSGAPRDGGARSRRGKSIPPDTLRRLRDATKALTEASSRGEVLPLVIRFASEVFGRVAMFMVRDGTAVGMAQHGLPACGGPDDRDLRELAFPCSASSWLGMVLEQGKAVRGAPGNDGDRDFAGLLGDRVPAQAYLAPIESTGQVIALLYADNLPEDGPLGDTSALEVVLHHAGLALDRAALERALREGAD